MKWLLEMKSFSRGVLHQECWIWWASNSWVGKTTRQWQCDNSTEFDCHHTGRPQCSTYNKKKVMKTETLREDHWNNLDLSTVSTLNVWGHSLCTYSIWCISMLRFWWLKWVSDAFIVLLLEHVHGKCTVTNLTPRLHLKVNLTTQTEFWAWNWRCQTSISINVPSYDSTCFLARS